MLTGEQLHAVWFIAYRASGMIDHSNVRTWESEPPAQKGAWNSLAKWIEQYDKHTRSCPFRTGKGECSC